jgi:putative tricarboxylic transport membrane protein
VQTVIAVFLSRILADLALKLGPWEYFLLGFCAILLVAALPCESVFHGLAAAAFGLFAIKQVVTEFACGSKPAPKVDVSSIRGFGVSLANFNSNTVNMIRSFMIGLWIGFLPAWAPACPTWCPIPTPRTAQSTPRSLAKAVLMASLHPRLSTTPRSADH